MKLPKALVSSVIALGVFLAGCGSVPERVPEPTATVWRLGPELTTRKFTVIRAGDSVDDVVSALGLPRKKRVFRTDASIQVFSFVMSSIGPIRQRTVNTTRGVMDVKDNTTYADHIDVYFKEGRVSSVTVDRSVYFPNGTLGLRDPL